MVAAAGIHRLVPVRVLDQARLRLTADPDAAFPPAPGQRVGTLRVTIRGATVGAAPLLIGTLPPPEPADGPWWARASGALGRAILQVVQGLVP